MARIAIAGSGAIGGLAGFYMARAGEDVLFIDQNAEHVAAIRERGISVNGVYGPMSVPPQRACTPGEIPEPLDGLVFLACKSQATEAAVRAIAPHLGPSACVVSLQNGMNEDTIAGIVGRERTMGALPDYGGAYLDPGVLEAVHEGTVYVGELDGSLTPRVREAARLLGIGPNKCELLTDIVGRLWTKHVYNSQIVVTALVNDTVVAVLGHKDVQRRGGAAARRSVVRPGALPSGDVRRHRAPARRLRPARGAPGRPSSRRRARRLQVRQEGQLHPLGSGLPQAAERGCVPHFLYPRGLVRRGGPAQREDRVDDRAGRGRQARSRLAQHRGSHRVRERDRRRAPVTRPEHAGIGRPGRHVAARRRTHAD